MVLVYKNYIQSIFVNVQMRALYRDPQGKNIFGNVVIQSSESSKSVALHSERSQRLALEKEVQSLQAQLKHQQSVSTNMEYVQDPVCHCVYRNLDLSLSKYLHILYIANIKNWYEFFTNTLAMF